MLINDSKMYLTTSTAASKLECQLFIHVSTTMYHALPILRTSSPHGCITVLLQEHLHASQRPPALFSPLTTLHSPTRFSLCMGGLHIPNPTPSPDWLDPSPCVPSRPNMSQWRTKGQGRLAQRPSHVIACVFAGYSGVLSTISYPASRGEEELKGQEGHARHSFVTTEAPTL